MNIELDWSLFAIGLLAGSAAAVLYFAGLAWGMRLALRRARPVAVLLPSAALRIAALLAAGWWIAGQGAFALAGFALAFVAARVVLLIALRPAEGRATWI